MLDRNSKKLLYASHPSASRLDSVAPKLEQSWLKKQIRYRTGWNSSQRWVISMFFAKNLKHRVVPFLLSGQKMWLSIRVGILHFIGAAFAAASFIIHSWCEVAVEVETSFAHFSQNATELALGIVQIIDQRQPQHYFSVPTQAKSRTAHIAHLGTL